MNTTLVCAMSILLAAAACDRTDPPAIPVCKAGSVSVDSTVRAQLIVARDAVWRAYFAGDSAALVRILPEPMIGMGETRAEIIANSQAFARGGGRLEKLEFTCDEFFVSGDVAVVFSNYRTDLREGETVSVTTGRAIELFERRDGAWVNPSWHLDEDGRDG